MTLQVVPRSAGAPGARPTGPQGQTKESMAYATQLRVLIIDDEPSICKALSMALTRTGYEAIAAQSGEAALAVIREEHIVRPTRLRTLGSRKKFMHPRSSCPS